MTSVAPAAALPRSMRIRLLGGTSSLALSMASAVLALGVALSGEAQAQTTVNPNQSTTYRLTSANNPITFGSATQINTAASVAVFGDGGTPWNVTIQNGGTIVGGGIGILLDSPSTLTNAGAIAGGGGGAFLLSGGNVTNSGTIRGDYGVYIRGSGSVTNSGTIGGSVSITSSGSVINQAGGLISGDIGVAIGATSPGDGSGVTVTTGVTVTLETSRSAVLQSGGSTVTNQAGGTIAGNLAGVYIGGVAGTVTNAGSITAAYAGVALFAGGGVTNSGTIQSGNSGVSFGVEVRGGAGTVTNAGSIIATGYAGVALFAGGSVTNSGTIRGGNFFGVEVQGAAGTVTNAGTITGGVFGVGLGAGGSVTNSGTISAQRIGVLIDRGNGEYGVPRFAGAVSVTNQKGGTISGYYGVYILRGGTVTNAGTITGTGGVAVKFGVGGANTLILQTGSVLNGNAVGSTVAGSTNALILQGIGTANNSFLNFNTLDVQAGGVWALNGVSSIGATTVSSGTLAIGDAAHPGAALTSLVTVMAGGTLAGQGTVIGDITVLGGGAVAPGAANPFSTLNVTGNATFASGSLYQVNISGAGQTDKLSIGGSANLTGGSVQANLAPGNVSKHSYDILHATGGLGGTSFNGVSNNLPGFSESLSYTSTDVFLTPTAQLGAGGGLGRNQQNLANAINNFFNTGGTLPAAFVPLFGLSGANLGNALSQNSGEASAGAQQGAFQLMTGFLGLMIDPSVDGRGGSGGTAVPFAPERATLPPDIALAYAKAMKAPPPNFEQRWNVWGSAFGGANHTSGDPGTGSTDLSAHAAGVAVGADYHLSPDTLIGFALAGGGTSWSLAQNLGGGRSDAFQAGLYGKTYNGPAYFAASLAFANHWMSTDRFAFAADHVTASFDAQSLGGRFEGGYRFAMPLAGITPYAAVQAQSFHTPGYSETDLSGGGFGLAFAARTATDTRSELGSRFDSETVVSSDAMLTLRGRVAWAHDWISDPTLAASFQALPGASFIVNGATPAKDSALTSAGAELRWQSGWSLMAKFDGELASRSQTYTGTGTVRYSW